jgi:ABC-type Zn uptake system ZnuABC Zn-binding protein ZnuA
VVKETTMRRNRKKGTKPLACVLALAAAALVGVPDAGADVEPLQVCGTTPDLGALTQEVGGDRVRLTVFVKPTEDPHFAEARPSYVRALNEADLFIQIGLDLETGYAPLLLQQARNPRILQGTQGFLDASVAIDRRLDVPTGAVDRSMGDVHAAGNPHFLLDPLRGLAVARLIAQRLAVLRPESKTYFDERLADFQRRLFTALVGPGLAARYGDDVPKLALLYRNGKLASFLDEQRQRAELGGWLAAMLPHLGARAVDDHPIWSYFAETFGLRIVAHLEPLPGVPPTTKHLERVIEAIRAQGVRIVLASAYYDPRYARLVAESTGAKVLAMANQVEAVPAAKTYLDMVTYNVERVVSALGPAS